MSRIDCKFSGRALCCCREHDLIFIIDSSYKPLGCKLYQRSGHTWVEETTIVFDPVFATDTYARSVCLSPDGKMLFISTFFNGSTSDPEYRRGSIRYYRKIDGVWTFVSTISRPSAEVSYFFGARVALARTGTAEDGECILVTSSMYAPNAGATGHIWTYSLANDVWSLENHFTPDDTISISYAGTDLDLTEDGNLLAITEPREARIISTSEDSRVRFYVRSGYTWTENTTLRLTRDSPPSLFAASCTLSEDGMKCAVSDILQTSDTVGKVYLLEREGSGAWTFVRELSPSDGPVAQFGALIRLSTENNLLLVANTSQAHTTTAAIYSFE